MILHRLRRTTPKVVHDLAPAGAAWLDAGRGRQFIPPWAREPEAQRQVAARSPLLAGTDIDPAIRERPVMQNRIIGLGGSFPFRDGSFQLATANMVVAHVPKPAAFLRDVHGIPATD